MISREISKNDVRQAYRIGPSGQRAWDCATRPRLSMGVTKGTVSGMLAADNACGVENTVIDDMEAIVQPIQRPPLPRLR